MRVGETERGDEKLDELGMRNRRILSGTRENVMRTQVNGEEEREVEMSHNCDLTHFIPIMISNTMHS